jgi:hypothetical protein
MTRLFISYRRADSAGYAGRLYDHLSQLVGPDALFMDIDDIPPGEDFVKVIEDAISVCDTVLVVIGPQWTEVTNPQGQRRLDDPYDFVRLEIATALKRDIRVIPVLVGGASMPGPSVLPDTLVLLARRNAVELSDNRFKYDVERLVRSLKLARAPRAVKPPEAKPPKAQTSEVKPSEAKRPAARQALTPPPSSAQAGPPVTKTVSKTVTPAPSKAAPAQVPAASKAATGTLSSETLDVNAGTWVLGMIGLAIWAIVLPYLYDKGIISTHIDPLGIQGNLLHYDIIFGNILYIMPAVFILLALIWPFDAWSAAYLTFVFQLVHGVIGAIYFSLANYHEWGRLGDKIIAAVVVGLISGIIVYYVCKWRGAPSA